MLADRDAKLEQLTAQLKAASSATSAQPSVPNQDIASGPSEEGGRTPSNSAFDGMSDLKLEFQGQIMKLQQYIEANNLRHVDPLGNPGCLSLLLPLLRLHVGPVAVTVSNPALLFLLLLLLVAATAVVVVSTGSALNATSTGLVIVGVSIGTVIVAINTGTEMAAVSTCWLLLVAHCCHC